MVKLICFFAIMFMHCTSIFAQIATYQKVAEVYGNAFVNDNPTLFQSFSELLEKRVKYIREPETQSEKYPKISTLGLKNKNNPNLSVDTQFDESTFNPLKYNIEMFASNTQVYRIDNTDFLIVIEPQNK